MISYRKIKEEIGFEPYMNAFVYQIYIPMLLMIWVRSLESGLENKFIWVYSIIIYIGLKIYQIITKRVNGSNKRMIDRGIWVQGIYLKVYKKLFLLQLIEKKLFYEKKERYQIDKKHFYWTYLFSPKFQWFMRLPYLVGLYFATIGIPDAIKIGFPNGVYLELGIVMVVFIIMRIIELLSMKTIDFEN